MVRRTTKTFSNGLRASYAHIRGHPDVALHLVLDVGGKNDPKGREGTAHLLEHMMFRGNEFRDRRSIKKLASRNLIRHFAATSVSDTVLELQFPSQGLARAAQLGHECVAARVHQQGEFDAEKEVIIEGELRDSEHDPIHRFLTKISGPKVFEGTYFALDAGGTKESVGRITLDEMLKFKDRFYVPSNIIISGAGGADPKDFFRYIEKRFGKMSGEPTQQPTHPSKIWAFKPGLHYEAVDWLNGGEPEKDQCYLEILFKVPKTEEADSGAVCLLADILGSGDFSYLFEELRDKRGLCYGANADYVDDEGITLLNFNVMGLHPSKLEETVRAIKGVIEKVKEGNIDRDMYEAKKRSGLYLLRKGRYDPTLWAKAGVSAIVRPGTGRMRGAISRARKINRDDVARVANDYLTQEPLIIVASAPGYNHDGKIGWK